MTVDTKRLRELAEAATPGPWRDANGNGAASVVSEHPDYACQIYLNVRTFEIKDTVDRWQADSRFIAAANPQTVIALLDALDEANRRSEVSYSTGIGYARDERDRLREEKWALEQQLAAMTAARDEACDLALDAIDGTSEHGLRIRELRKVGQ